ncbi:PREDICTED: carboxypeptidase O-like [Nanorana parkeri]|uniref:carboxypeptidase O-like n=1 Tax=Nanorana parkeri TaxID=125878 RepID=UPI000854897F|nr:PREDICTED: carboxypeptidase O-like [Nanorana parkeri]
MEPSTQDCGQLALASTIPAKNRLKRKRRDSFSSFRKMYLLLWNVGFLGILSLQVLGTKINYERDQVLQIIPQNVKQVQCLYHICQSSQLDLWKPLYLEDVTASSVVLVRVPSIALQTVKEELLRCSLSFDVLLDNITHYIGSEERRRVRKKRSTPDYDYTKYHPMEDIYEWINIMSEKHTDLLTQHYLGSTYESRPMHYLKISEPSSNPKKIVWMDCGIHAREWIAPAFCQWFVKEIVQNYPKDARLKKILRNLDLYVLPVLNIDGYIYSWTTDRLWRKSRSMHENGTCFGVDLNRNFNIKWCNLGSSKNCSDNSYCGTSPVSEPETKAVVDFVEKSKSDIICFLTMHSYSQYILTAYGYTKDLPKSYNETIKVAQMAASELKKKHGTVYKVGSFAHLLYEASGTSQDWVHDLGIEFSYTIELRDNGTHKFLLPEDQIQPTCEETMAAVLTIIDSVHDKYFPNKAPTNVHMLYSVVLLLYTAVQLFV